MFRWIRFPSRLCTLMAVNRKIIIKIVSAIFLPKHNRGFKGILNKTGAWISYLFNYLYVRFILNATKLVEYYLCYVCPWVDRWTFSMNAFYS